MNTAIALDLQDKFATTRKELAACLIERDDEIDLALTALIAQEHLLLVGPPGTAKSLLCDSLTGWLTGGNLFSILLTKFSVPEEVFGPISVSGLKADIYRRIPTGKLPEATISFIDEIFKASSAILNTLLKIINERTWQNDGTLVKCPLRLCVAASNEWPNSDTGKELEALFDRFLFRKPVKPIATQRGLSSLLWAGNLTPALSTTITPAEIDAAHVEATATPWSDEAKEAIVTIIGDARREGIVAGDRRLRKSVAAVQSYAWLSGASEVAPDHLEILAHTLWADPAEQPRKLAEIVGKIANPQGMRVTALLQEAEQIVSGTDLKNLSAASVAVKKLGEIAKQLGSVSHPRSATAKEHVAAEVKRIKVASIESL
jgi:MoxR-like ATPase